MNKIRTAGFLVLLLGLMVQPARGQGTAAGTLTGVVQDANGGVLPGVTVTAAQPATGLTRTSVTGSQGEWTIPTLPTGEYTVTFELASFKKLVRPNVTVESGVPRSVNVTLELGAVSESITVTGGTDLLAPTTATTFRRLSAEDLTLIPTTTRSFTHLLSSEAGVSADLPPALINGTGNISPSVNGTRTTSTSLFFNGIDATNLTSNEGSLSDNIAPAPETLEEVKLQTSLYDAATGRSGGGNFQLVTRAGTNLFKGSGYYDFQHEGMNANDFFYELDGIEKPKARRNEGGFTIGGPVRRNKVFFFGAYQRTQAETAFVPTASSITILPAALRLIQGARTKENLHAAFASLNPSFLTSIPKAQCNSPADNQCITDVGFALFSLRNPVTGDYAIPAPREGLATTGVDIVAGPSVGGNPLVRQRNVQPAEFQQDQLTARLDTQFTNSHRLSITGVLFGFPGAGSVPGSVQPRLPVHAASRGSERHARDLRHDADRQPDDQRAARRRLLAQQLAPAGRSVPRDHERLDWRAEPCDVLRQLGRDAAPRALRRSARHADGALLDWRTERHVQPAASADDHGR